MRDVARGFRELGAELRQPRWQQLGLLAALLLVAVALRCSSLSSSSLDLSEIEVFPAAWPEASSPKAVRGRLYGQLLAEVWERTLSEAWVRLPSALAGSATVLLAAMAARFTGTGAAPFPILALLAFWPLHVRASRTVDPGACLLFAGVVGWVLGIAAARGNSPRTRWLLLAASALVLLSATSMTGATVWIWASVAFAWWMQRSPLRGAGLLFWVAACVVSLGLWARQGLPAPSFWPVSLEPSTVLRWWGTLPPWLGVTTWVVAAVGFLAAVRGREERPLAVAALVALGALVFAHLQRWHLDLASNLVLVLPALLLIARGFTALAAMGSRFFGHERLWVTAAVLAVIAVLGPLVRAEMSRAAPNWKLIARTLIELREPGEIFVPSLSRKALVFYEPEFAFWAAPDAQPASAISYFPSAQRGWLVVGPVAKLFPGFDKVLRWAAQFDLAEISPDRQVMVFRYDRSGPEVAWRRLAYQPLPAEAVAQPKHLLAMLRAAGFAAPALWKVDQVLLGKPGELRPDAEWLQIVGELTEAKHADRAASLAVFLAGRFPEWAEMQRLRALFLRPPA